MKREKCCKSRSRRVSNLEQFSRTKSYDLNDGGKQEDLGTGMYAVKSDFEEIQIFHDVNAAKVHETGHESTPEGLMHVETTEENNDGQVF